MPRAWRTLTLLQHVLVVALTLVGLIRSTAAGAEVWLVTPTSAALLGLYAVGVFRRWTSPWWLLGMTGIWIVLVLLSPENVWIAFSLWLLAGHFLPLAGAIAYSSIVLAVVIGAPWLAQGMPSLPEVLGPSIGAVFAIAVSRGQIQLVRDAVERQRLLDSVIAAQAETEELHAELAAAQREAGALAERTRLSRDIHDTLAQEFSSIVLLARAGRAQDETGLRAIVEQIESTAHAGLTESRRVVGALAPTDLEDAGLPAALRRLTTALTEQTGIDAAVHVDGPLPPLPTTVEVALLRIAQGALANVRQHAQASRVTLSLNGTDDTVRLEITDDGIGFDPDQRVRASPARGGYGLAASRARTHELGGTLTIESAPGAGTTVSAAVPLRPEVP